jgi:hypothetical protein
MDSVLFSGVFELPGWGYLTAALVFDPRPQSLLARADKVIG